MCASQVSTETITVGGIERCPAVTGHSPSQYEALIKQETLQMFHGPPLGEPSVPHLGCLCDVENGEE